MPDRLAALYRTRYSALDARLSAPGAGAERDRLKNDIGDLFRSLDAELGELAKLKDEVRRLIERWKVLEAPREPSHAPEFVGDRPVVHADHLGAWTFIEQGWNLISAGDYTGAEAVLTKALELSPGEAQAESLLGWAMMLNERYDEALLAFRKVLMREPANALARVNLGYVCLRKGLLNESIEHLSRAIRLDRDRRATMYANFYLGLVYLERDMLDDAEIFLTKAIALGPSLVQARYELGRVYWRAGRRENACAAWRDGCAANKLSPWWKRCAEALDAVDNGRDPYGRSPAPPSCWRAGAPRPSRPRTRRCGCARGASRSWRRTRATRRSRGRCSPTRCGRTPSPVCRAPDRRRRSRSPATRGSFGSGSARRPPSGEAPSLFPRSSASSCRVVARARAREILWRCCATSWRTSRCTKRWATSRRAGSTRDTRASRRASGPAKTRSGPTSLLPCGERRRSMSWNVGSAGGRRERRPGTPLPTARWPRWRSSIGGVG